MSPSSRNATVAPEYQHHEYKEDEDDEDDYEDDDDDDDYDDGDYSKQVPISYLERLPRPHIGSIPYGQVITSCAVPGTIALTFDDGPSTYTSDLLDLLDSEDVRATFFVCGGNLDWDQITSHGNPAVLRRMMISGHQIGSHTWGHPDLATMTEEQVLSHMFKNEQALLSVLGVLPTYLRPPYLSTAGKTLDVMDKLGYHVVNLDLDTRDWARDYDAAEQNFLNAVKSSDPRASSHLVLAHDIHEQTVHQLAQFMIKEGKAAGYRFVTVGECLGDPMSNWYRNPYNGRPWNGKSSVAKRQIDEDPIYSGNKRFRFDEALNPNATSIVESGVDGHPFDKHLEQTMYAPEVTATSKVNSTDKILITRNAYPTPTKTIEIEFPFSGGQLPPTGFHMKPEMIEERGLARFHRGGPLITEYPVEAPTTISKVAASSVLPTSITTIEFDSSLSSSQMLPTGFVGMRSEASQQAGDQEEEAVEVANDIPLPTMLSRRDVPFIFPGNEIFFDHNFDHEQPRYNAKTQPKNFSGGYTSTAPSTLAFIIGIAAMVICLA